MRDVEQIVFRNVPFKQATAMVHELNEDYFRNIASSTTKPILARLKAIYEKHNRKYPWNAIVAIGLRIYAHARKGYDLDYVAYAKAIAQRWGIPETVAKEIVDAVLAEVRRA